MAWVKAEVHFATLYSYRVPNTSPSFSPASPVPSPSAVRLALVDAAIQRSGSVAEGRQVFDLVKDAPLRMVPPEGVCMSRAFVKRLKPGKGEELVKSTGVREYCHPLGPLELYIEVQHQPDMVVSLFQEIRRLGTTDSLAHCTATAGVSPPEDLVVRPLNGQVLALQESNFQGRMVVSLLEFPADVTFDAINPYTPSTRGFRYQQNFWVLPLVLTQRGESWAVYKRIPFTLNSS